MAGELEAYKRQIVGIYDRAAVEYGLFGPPIFRHAGRRLVDLAEVAPGARVLDVATGRGAVLFPAAKRVGPEGHVLGIDLSEAMVRETASEIERLGVRNAAVRVMDAEKLDLPDGTFDSVLCSFAIFFFPHVERVLATLRDLLRPGGIVGIGQAEEIDPRWSWQNELFQRYAVLESPPPAVRGGELRKPGVLKRLLEEAGFADVREVAEETEIEIGSRENWLDSLWTHGTRRAMEAMTPEGLKQFQADARAHLDRLGQSGSLTERYRFLFTLARRPVADV